MICRRCIRLSRARPSHFARSFSSTPLPREPVQAVQPPFTNPIPPKPIQADLPTSIAPAGYPLKGLNYLKGREDPVALEESEYPAWLWKCLEAKREEVGEAGDGDVFSKSKKLRRKAAKSQRKLEERLAATGQVLEDKVPITKQTVDLAPNEEARGELTKALRKERRKGIKDANFLKSM